MTRECSKDVTSEIQNARNVIILQIEQLSGRNEELRHELHNAREETAKAIMQVERKNTKVQWSFAKLGGNQRTGICNCF